MRFTIAALLAIATAAVARPEGAAQNSKLSTSAAFRAQGEGSQCDVGSLSCCVSAEETKNDSLLSGLLGGGVVNGLLGNSGSSCAKSSLIDDLGLLALVDHTDNGPVCKNIVACCPEGATTCVAVDNAGGDAAGHGKN